MIGIPKTPISDLLRRRILDIGDGYRAKNSELDSAGIPFARAGNINNGFLFENADLLGFKAVERVGSKLSRPCDCVITTKGTFGRVGYVQPSTSPFVYSPQLCFWRSLDFKKLEPRYVYYWLQGHEFLSQAHEIKSSTDMADYASLRDQRAMFISLPPPHIQRKIAAVLSAYDDLIENNNRRIALLEKMGEELYREWFVRLRFPGHESTKIVKGVPEGWTVESIGSVSKMVKRGISPVYDEASSSLVLNQKCIRNGKVNLEPARKHSSKVPNEKFLQKFDVLVNSTGVGTLGRVAVFTAETESLTVDSHVTIARANPDKINRLYYAGILCTKQEYFENLAIGATGQVELNKDGIERVQFLLPPNELQKQFGIQKAALLQLIEKTQQKQAALTLSRDRLLTRLMSGKIDLESLDIAFPPSMQEAA